MDTPLTQLVPSMYHFSFYMYNLLHCVYNDIEFLFSNEKKLITQRVTLGELL